MIFRTDTPRSRDRKASSASYEGSTSLFYLSPASWVADLLGPRSFNDLTDLDSQSKVWSRRYDLCSLLTDEPRWQVSRCPALVAARFRALYCRSRRDMVECSQSRWGLRFSASLFRPLTRSRIFTFRTNTYSTSLSAKWLAKSFDVVCCFR